MSVQGACLTFLMDLQCVLEENKMQSVCVLTTCAFLFVKQ